MLSLPRLVRRRLVLVFILFLAFILFNVSFIVLPPDSSVRLAVTFNTQRASNYLRSKAGDRDEWLTDPQLWPGAVDDTAFLVKTGYGTRHRIPGQLAAFQRTGGMLGYGQRKQGQEQSFIVVGDWTGVNETDNAALGVDVVDAVGMVMGMKSLKGMRSHPRFEKYRTLQAAVQAGDEEEALKTARRYGWELDALKFIMGMELLVREWPTKQWYVILDDDTFFVKSSLNMIISRLNPMEPLYIGNAVGDYKGRFAHGGSGVVISGQAMRMLFGRPDIIAQAYIDSLDETWGDKLVAVAFQKLGIYLEERFSHHFNGEDPSTTKISTDKFCAPLISFHEVREPGAMTQVADTLEELETKRRADGSPGSWYLKWGGVWNLFSESNFADIKKQPILQRKDHVGKRDENTKTWKHIKSSESCRDRCFRSNTWCLAWTFESEKGECHGSPWMIVGEDAEKSVSSGVIWEKVEPLVKKCLQH